LQVSQPQENFFRKEERSERMVAMDDLGLDDLQKRPLYHDPFFHAWMKENPDHL